MIRDNNAEKNNVVNDQETIQSNKVCRYRKATLIYPKYLKTNIFIEAI